MSRIIGAGFALLLGGCAAAAVGAGAGGAVYYTERGAESHVTTSVGQTFDAVKQTFEDMGITLGKTEIKEQDGQEKRTLEGTKGDKEIEITLEEKDNGTDIKVVAEKTEVTWDKELAKEVLSKIVERTTEMKADQN